MTRRRQSAPFDSEERPAAGNGRAFQRFFDAETAGGLLLLGGAMAALLAANSRWAEDYHRFWATPFTIGVPATSLSLTLHAWVNDALMSVFFLHVGLEIKRELVAGELSSRRQAALPIAGALGGMVLPAAVYLAVNHTGVAARGWGIPMATDIAFALGTLTLICPTIPIGAKVFLTALAIVDDMGAVAIIALFYTAELHPLALTCAALAVGALVTLNRMHVQRLALYLLLGALLWVFVHDSGVHSTIAGVLLALTIPTRTRINADQFAAEARTLIDQFERTETGDLLVLTSKGQQEALLSLMHASNGVTAPLLRLEHALHTFSAFVIMPVFAFANAGVGIGASTVDWKVMIGVMLGLALGKPLGITGASAMGVLAKVAELPRGVRWDMLHGCAWVAAIGFTMSLFIANLAFDGTDLLDSAKLGILAGSVVGVVVGAVALRVADRRRQPGR